MTIADEFREEGMEMGRVEGREEGLLVLIGLLGDGLISKEVYHQRAALLQPNTALV